MRSGDRFQDIHIKYPYNVNHAGYSSVQNILNNQFTPSKREENDCLSAEFPSYHHHFVHDIILDSYSDLFQNSKSWQLIRVSGLKEYFSHLGEGEIHPGLDAVL